MKLKILLLIVIILMSMGELFSQYIIAPDHSFGRYGIQTKKEFYIWSDDFDSHSIQDSLGNIWYISESYRKIDSMGTIIKLLPSGEKDPTFNRRYVGFSPTVLLEAHSRIYVGGYDYFDNKTPTILALTLDGKVDSTFGTNGKMRIENAKFIFRMGFIRNNLFILTYQSSEYYLCKIKPNGDNQFIKISLDGWFRTNDFISVKNKDYLIVVYNSNTQRIIYKITDVENGVIEIEKIEGSYGKISSSQASIIHNDTLYAIGVNEDLGNKINLGKYLVEPLQILSEHNYVSSGKTYINIFDIQIKDDVLIFSGNFTENLEDANFTLGIINHRSNLLSDSSVYFWIPHVGISYGYGYEYFGNLHLSDSLGIMATGKDYSNNYFSPIFFKGKLQKTTTETPSSPNPIRLYPDFENYSIYPNPTNGQINISFMPWRRTYYRIEVYNLLGNKLSEQTIETAKRQETQVAFHLNHLSSGIYFVKLIGPLGQQEVKKFVLTK